MLLLRRCGVVGGLALSFGFVWLWDRFGGVRTWLQVLAALGAVAPTQAQVNVEALTREEPPLGRSGALGGDLAVRTGNVDFVAVNLRARLYTVTESETRLIVGNGGIGFLDQSRFASSGLLHYRRTYTAVSEHFSPEWYLQANYDRPQLLDFRLVGGGGARTELTQGEWGEAHPGGTVARISTEKITYVLRDAGPGAN